MIKKISEQLRLMWNAVDFVQILQRKDPQFFILPQIKKYLQLSRQKLLDFLNEFPNGECKVDTELDSGEHIKLRLELQDEAVLFDFAGTSPSKTLCLTDAATFGACFGALGSFFHRPFLLNSGTFSLLQVLSPVGCLLNAKYPSPTFRGMTEGTAEVAGTVLKALTEIIPQKHVAISSQSPAQISLEFTSDLKFFDAIAGGGAATSAKNGEDAVQMWTRNNLKNSVQEIETLFPLQIAEIKLRPQSGGHGDFKGGDGLMKEYVLKSPAQLRWLLPSRKNSRKAKGKLDNVLGVSAEIRIYPTTGHHRTLNASSGHESLNAGDRIIVCSAGGGGFNKSDNPKLA